MKKYLSQQSGLRIVDGDITFIEGVFLTDNKDVQKKIERHQLFGTVIQVGKKPTKKETGDFTRKAKNI